MRKTPLILLALLLVFLGAQNAQNSAQNSVQNPVFAQELNVYFFWGDGCPHCEKEKRFLSGLQAKYPIKIHDYEIFNNPANLAVLKKVAGKAGVKAGRVPLTVIGDKHFLGFNELATPAAIEEQINYCLANACGDAAAGVIQGGEQSLSTKIKLPFFGEADAAKFSLPALTVILGVLDGFNPCAMWVLVFLISMLIGMQNRFKMWFLGGSFIAASALVYFFFMAAWLNLILFLGLIMWVRLAIGAAALFCGAWKTKEFFTNKEAYCKVTGGERRQRIFQKIRDLIHQDSFWLALAGIIVLAFAVNLVELICSAGLPAVYTQVLALSRLAAWQHYGYMLVYILFFMLDDLIVFFAAMVTLEVTGVTAKYTRAANLIGGVLMLVIGLLLVFKPQWLMFG